MRKHISVPVFIAAAPTATQPALKTVRAIVRKVVPDALETISYGMPAYTWRGKPLFYFAAMKAHLGLYPTSGPIKTCSTLLGNFSTSKGSIRVPYSSKIPTTLIRKLLAERKKEIEKILSTKG